MDCKTNFKTNISFINILRKSKFSYLNKNTISLRFIKKMVGSPRLEIGSPEVESEFRSFWQFWGRQRGFKILLLFVYYDNTYCHNIKRAQGFFLYKDLLRKLNNNFLFKIIKLKKPAYQAVSGLEKNR